MQTIDLIEKWVYGMSKGLVRKKKRLNATIWQNNTKKINFDNVTKENHKGHKFLIIHTTC